MKHTLLLVPCGLFAPALLKGFTCTTRRSNQSILKEFNSEYSLLKLKLQYFGYLMWRANILEKTVMLGKIEGRSRKGDRGWNGWMASWTQWTWVWATPGGSGGWGAAALGVAESDTILAAEQQQLLHAPGGAEHQGDMPQSQPTLSCLSYSLTPRGHPHLPSPRIGPALGDFIVLI